MHANEVQKKHAYTCAYVKRSHRDGRLGDVGGDDDLGHALGHATEDARLLVRGQGGVQGKGLHEALVPQDAVLAHALDDGVDCIWWW
jgi:hypothetical protein